MIKAWEGEIEKQKVTMNLLNKSLRASLISFLNRNTDSISSEYFTQKLQKATWKAVF